MRLSTMESSDDGIFRWDQVKDPDPRCVCLTCYHFAHETKTCKNPEKQFFVHVDRRIYDYESMRCVSHSMNHDVTMYLKSEFKGLSIKDIEQKRHDLENELSRIQDFEEIKKRFGVLLHDNPFQAITRDIKEIVSNEIDLDIYFKRDHPDYGFWLQIDAATLEKVNQATMWITGFNREHCGGPHAFATHHSFFNVTEERFILKQHQLIRVILIKNGHRICATVSDFITLMQNPTLLDRCINVDQENFRLAETVNTFLHSFVVKTHVPFPLWNKNYLFSDLFRFTFSDLANFKQTFKCFEKDSSLNLEFALSGEHDDKTIEIVHAGYLYSIEFVGLIDELQKFLDSRKIACRINLSSDDQALIREMKGTSA